MRVVAFNSNDYFYAPPIRLILIDMKTRKIVKKDLPFLKAVLDTSGLFPSDLLDEMIADYFANKATTDIWFTTELDGKPVSIGFCAPEKLTNGTYNLYAIAVDKGLQGKGIGQAMMHYIENYLRELKGRILIVDTSSGADFELTRQFYLKCNYTLEATLRDFWDEGDDKVVFWKKIG